MGGGGEGWENGGGWEGGGGVSLLDLYSPRLTCSKGNKKTF